MKWDLHRIRAQECLAIGDTKGARAEIKLFVKGVTKSNQKDNPALGTIWHLQLKADLQDGRPEDAIGAGSRLARLARGRGWHKALSLVLTQLGYAALQLGDLPRAALWFEESGLAASKVNNHILRAQSRLGLAATWEHRGEVALTRQALQQVKQLLPAELQTVDAVRVRASALRATGRLLICSGTDSPRAVFDEARRLFEQLRDYVEVVQTLLDELPHAVQRGEFERANELLSWVDERMEPIADRLLIGRIAMARGDLCRAQDEYKAARKHYQESLGLVPIGHPDRALVQLHIALTDIAAGDRRSAYQALPNLLKITRSQRHLAGLTHLLAIAIGPIGKRDTEDDLWSRHGTPAIRSLQGTAIASGVEQLVLYAVRRMSKRADAVQGGRAARILGLIEPEPFLVSTLRHTGAALPVGPFLALNQIGEGGMAQVWLGRHVDSDHPAAIKILRTSVQKSTMAWKSFDIELKAVCALNHPCIVRLIDHGRAGAAAEQLSGGRVPASSPYLAIEFMPGGPLSPWIRGIKFPQIQRVLTDLLHALAHAHARSILHLDLKPDNILLRKCADPGAGVKLADFGLALLAHQSRESFAGTPAFMSPEQFMTPSNYGPWTDLYALGCLAWGLATGTPPFTHDDTQTLAMKHLHGELPTFHPTTPVPPGYERWCRRLLKKRPLDRFTRARDALDALEILAPPLTALPRTDPIIQVADAGLSLILERDPPLQGRTAVRAQLRKQFDLCAETNSPRAFQLIGPEGSGRERIADWLAATTHEQGLSEIYRQPRETTLQDFIGGKRTTSPGSTAMRLVEKIEQQRRGRVAVVILNGSEPDLPMIVEIVLREAEGPLFFILCTTTPCLRKNRSLHSEQLLRLSPPQVQEILRSILPLHNSLVQDLVRWADGNPGLAISTLRDLAASGALRSSKKGWYRPNRGSFTVPHPLQQSLQLLLDSAAPTPAHVEALQVAAAFGVVVHQGAWRALCTCAIEVGEQLHKSGILLQRGGTYRWSQPAALHMIAAQPGTRVAHGRIADHLKSLGAPPALIATHYVSAHRYADAHRPLLDAVAAALEADDKKQAKIFYAAWNNTLDRLAVTPGDPRRLAGRKYSSQL